MADLSITAANVVKGTGAVPDASKVAGETVTAGQTVYLKASDNRWWKSQADATSTEAAASGIALNGASAGQPLVVQTAGEITIGATVAVGGVYVVSATAGGIAPVADLASTNYLTVIGYGKTTAIIVMDVNPTGIQVA